MSGSGTSSLTSPATVAKSSPPCDAAPIPGSRRAPPRTPASVGAISSPVVASDWPDPACTRMWRTHACVAVGVLQLVVESAQLIVTGDRAGQVVLEHLQVGHAVDQHVAVAAERVEHGPPVGRRARCPPGRIQAASRPAPGSAPGRVGDVGRAGRQPGHDGVDGLLAILVGDGEPPLGDLGLGELEGDALVQELGDELGVELLGSRSHHLERLTVGRAGRDVALVVGDLLELVGERLTAQGPVVDAEHVAPAGRAGARGQHRDHQGGQHPDGRRPSACTTGRRRPRVADAVAPAVTTEPTTEKGAPTARDRDEGARHDGARVEGPIADATVPARAGQGPVGDSCDGSMPLRPSMPAGSRPRADVGTVGVAAPSGGTTGGVLGVPGAEPGVDADRRVAAALEQPLADQPLAELGEDGLTGLVLDLRVGRRLGVLGAGVDPGDEVAALDPGGGADHARRRGPRRSAATSVGKASIAWQPKSPPGSWSSMTDTSADTAAKSSVARRATTASAWASAAAYSASVGAAVAFTRSPAGTRMKWAQVSPGVTSCSLFVLVQLTGGGVDVDDPRLGSLGGEGPAQRGDPRLDLDLILGRGVGAGAPLWDCWPGSGAPARRCRDPRR